MISTVLWILGIVGFMLLVFVISEGIGEIFGHIQEIVGGLVAGIMSLILRPFPFLLKILIGGAIVVGSFYLIHPFQMVLAVVGWLYLVCGLC